MLIAAAALRPRASCRARASVSVPVICGVAHQVGDRDLARVLQAGAAAREHDRADGGDEQQDRGDLEREQEVGQQQPADLGRRAEAREPARALLAERRSGPCRGSRSPARRTARRRTARSPSAGSAEPARPQRVVAAADVGDDEQVQHHDRADVDDHLRRGEELRAQQQEQRGERQQVARPARAPCRTGCAAPPCRSRPRGRRSPPGRRRPRPCGAPRLLARRAQRRALERLREQHLLREDQVGAVVVGQLVVVAHRDRVERARRPRSSRRRCSARG